MHNKLNNNNSLIINDIPIRRRALSYISIVDTFVERIKAVKAATVPFQKRNRSRHKMRSRHASMSTLANYKEKASKFQRAINLINVIVVIESIFLINQGLDLFTYYHLGHVSHHNIINDLSFDPTMCQGYCFSLFLFSILITSNLLISIFS